MTTPNNRDNWTDEAIKSEIEDCFGFVDYVEVLTKRLLKSATPMTVGIFGRWGSGKSSAMELIREKIRKKRLSFREKIEGRLSLPGKSAGKRPRRRRSNDDVPSIWINVWQLANQEEVWHAFLQSLFTEVHRRLPLWKRVDWLQLLRQLVTNSYRIGVAVTPIVVGIYLGIENPTWNDVICAIVVPFSKGVEAGTGAVISITLSIWTILKPAIEKARETVNFDLKKILKFGSYESQLTELRRLQDRFENYVRALTGEEGRLIVFIDDLDRCTPNRVPEVLEAIKLFASTKRCIYVLGLDREIVTTGIARRYSFNTEEAEAYLEKVVQIPFHLPPLEMDSLSRFIENQYPIIYDRCPAAATVFAKGLESNPRIIKRAMNVYRTIIDLSEQRVKMWEMDPVDDELVAKMVVIQSRFTKLYRKLATDPPILSDIEEIVIKNARENQLGSLLKNQDLAKKLQLGDKSKDALIDEKSLAILGNLLNVGEERFGNSKHKHKISSYIYLVGAASEGTSQIVKPHREQRQVLLGNNPVEIKQMVDDLLTDPGDSKVVRKTYRERLHNVLDYSNSEHTSGIRYDKEEIVSANRSLDEFEGWQHLEFEPVTVRVPGGWLILGSDTNEVKRAIEDGLDNQSAKLEQAGEESSLNLLAFRIGRFPVTNGEFDVFVEDIRKQPNMEDINDSLWHLTPIYSAVANISSATSSDDKREQELILIDGPSSRRIEISLQLPLTENKEGSLSLLLIDDQGDNYVEKIPVYKYPADSGKDGFLVKATLYVETSDVIAGLNIINWKDEPSSEDYTSLNCRVAIWKKETADRFTKRLNAIWQADRWNSWKYHEKLIDHPATGISWWGAIAYCHWLSKKTGKKYHLPNEAEWEAAARGTGILRSVYPWGDEWKEERANTKESRVNDTTSVGNYSPEGDSRYGVADMSGNVWEWCADDFGEYRKLRASGYMWDDFRFRVGTENSDLKTIRGGSYYVDKVHARPARRDGYSSILEDGKVGFRVAADLDPNYYHGYLLDIEELRERRST